MDHVEESAVVFQDHHTLLFVPHREIIDYGGQKRHNSELATIFIATRQSAILSAA